MEIKSWTGGVFKLFSRPFYLPQAGDRFVAHPGCDKTRATCKAKFSNLLNFRASPTSPARTSITPARTRPPNDARRDHRRGPPLPGPDRPPGRTGAARSWASIASA
jgi:hypothetical protein